MVQKVKIKVKPYSLDYPSPIPCEKVRSVERGQKNALNLETRQEILISQPMRNCLSLKIENKASEWILKRERNKVYTRDGNVLFECWICRNVDKPMFFATENDLTKHVARLHCGYPNNQRRPLHTTLKGQETCKN